MQGGSITAQWPALHVELYPARDGRHAAQGGIALPHASAVNAPEKALMEMTFDATHDGQHCEPARRVQSLATLHAVTGSWRMSVTVHSPVWQVGMK